MSQSSTVEQPVIRQRPPALTTDRAVEKFVKLRDDKAAIEKRHAQELLPYTAAMNTLEAWLLEDLQAASAESIRTLHGTIFKTIATSAKVTEWRNTIKFIIENELWDLLEARVSKISAEAYIAEKQQSIPGVEVSRRVKLNVRRS